MLGISPFPGGAAARRPGKSLGLASALALVVGAGLLAATSSGAPALAGPKAPAAVTQSSGMLNAVLPWRILDTRTTTGGHHAKLGPGATMRLAVLGGGGVPGAGVSAVMVNLTAVNETVGAGYLTLFPTGVSRPLASTLNYRGGVAVANQALVRVGSDGTISIFNSAGTTDVIVDVEGWVEAAAAVASGQVTTATPTRILDTRTTTGGHQAPLGNGQSLTLQVAGAGGIPTGVSAVYANVTAVPVGNAAAGYLTAYPGGTTQPLSSTVSFLSGGATASLTLLQVSAAGTITVTNHSPGANVLVDVAGWVSGGDVMADAGTQAIPVTRVLDTRSTLGGHQAPVGSNGRVSVRVLGTGGVPSSGVAAVVVHVTGVAPTANTYLKAFGTGYPTPASSVVNMAKGATVANTALVPVGRSGTVTVYNYSGTQNVLLDVQGWIAAPVLTPAPPQASALGAGALTTADGERAASILTNANRYAMTTWWNTIYPSLIAAPMRSESMFGDATAPLTFNATAVSTTDSVRRLSMEAFSLATSLATDAYNPAAAPAGTGVPTATATSRAVQLISKVVAGHLTNTSGGWGATTESEIDTGYLGLAAWMLWPQLTSQVQSQVAKMVYFEAEWGMDQPVSTYANAAGTVIHPGDTQADGDSWVPMPDQLAVAMLPDNPHVPLWQNTVVRDALVAWSRPSDDANATLVNGASVASWINNTGSNVLSTGDLINHNRYAPDYSTLIYQNMQDILVSALAGQPAPQAVTALIAPVYAAYTTVKYAAPPNLKPGGTVYLPGSAAIYYPQGCDWGTGQEIPYAVADAETAAFGAGTATSATYEDLHAGKQLAMQQLHADGHTYDTNAQYVYVGREEHTSQLAAQLYLTKYVRDHALSSFSDASYWLAP